MPSDVKGCAPLFLRPPQRFFPFVYRQRRHQENTTVEHADLRGWGPPCLASVGGLPQARAASPWRPPNAAEGSPTPGRRLCHGPWGSGTAVAFTRRGWAVSGVPGPCWAMAPSKARHARALATTTCGACGPGARRGRERWQRRPWAGPLVAGRALCQAPLAVTLALGWRAVRPGACAEHAAGMGGARCDHGPLSALRPGGVC
jgi:hypothetical protein